MTCVILVAARGDGRSSAAARDFYAFRPYWRHPLHCSFLNRSQGAVRDKLWRRGVRRIWTRAGMKRREP